MEVTQLDTAATVPESSFEIPADYEETEMQILPSSAPSARGTR